MSVIFCLSLQVPIEVDTNPIKFADKLPGRNNCKIQQEQKLRQMDPQMCNQEDQLQRTGSRSRKGLADTGPNWPNGEGADNRQDGITSFLPAERAEKLKRKIKTQDKSKRPRSRSRTGFTDTE